MRYSSHPARKSSLGRRTSVADLDKKIAQVRAILRDLRDSQRMLRDADAERAGNQVMAAVTGVVAPLAAAGADVFFSTVGVFEKAAYSALKAFASEVASDAHSSASAASTAGKLGSSAATMAKEFATNGFGPVATATAKVSSEMVIAAAAVEKKDYVGVGKSAASIAKEVAEAVGNKKLSKTLGSVGLFADTAKNAWAAGTNAAEIHAERERLTKICSSTQLMVAKQLAHWEQVHSALTAARRAAGGTSGGASGAW